MKRLPGAFATMACFSFWRKSIIAVVILSGCASVACPKTVQVEAGTGVRHEVGESPVKTNTAIVRATWEFRK